VRAARASASQEILNHEAEHAAGPALRSLSQTAPTRI
jgi:hypothetical protein